MSRSLPLVLMTALLTGCWWNAPTNDAGDRVFAHQAIRVVLGRQPLGSAEVDALADIVASEGRETALDVLFARPEYVTHWANVLVDDLQVQRDGVAQVDSQCVERPLLEPSASNALAYHLATADPEEPFCYTIYPTLEPIEPFEWNTDALQEEVESLAGEVRLDELDPYRPMESEGSGATGGGLPPQSEIVGTGTDHTPGSSAPYHPQKLASTEFRRWYDDFRWNGREECPTFNLSDAAHAAVRADRVDGLYRAYLPVLAARFDSSSGMSVLDDGPPLYANLFLDVYLQRDTTCMQCHTSTWSTTDPDPIDPVVWDRFYGPWHGLPLPWDLEGSVFSYDEGNSFVYGGDGGNAVHARVAANFTFSNKNGPILPFGITPSCTGGYERGYEHEDAHFAGVGPSEAGVLPLVDALGQGTASLGSIRARTPDWDGWLDDRGAPGVSGNEGCSGCHQSNTRRLITTTTDARLIQVLQSDIPVMGRQAQDDQEALQIVRNLRAQYGRVRTVETQDRNQAFAIFVAQTLASHVIEATWGRSPILQHGYSRNPEQAALLADVGQAIGAGFSLQEGLKVLLLSEAFSRSAPESPSTTPYALPMLTVAEADLGPSVPNPPLPNTGNSEGDFVHRAPATVMLQQVAGALGWPEPTIGGDVFAYPTTELMIALGRHSDLTRGEQREHALDSWLRWEQDVATCEKPETVLALDVHRRGPGNPWDLIGPDAWDDWIDVLVADTSGTDASWSDVLGTVRDRLLANAAFTSNERAAIEAAFELDVAGPIDDARLEPVLRGYCGALLRTPDFVLRGLAPPVETAPPALQVCFEDEPCSREERYERFLDGLTY